MLGLGAIVSLGFMGKILLGLTKGSYVRILDYVTFHLSGIKGVLLKQISQTIGTDILTSITLH